MSQLKSAFDSERAELNNELTSLQQHLGERTKELQRLQENFHQVCQALILGADKFFLID